MEWWNADLVEMAVCRVSRVESNSENAIQPFQSITSVRMETKWQQQVTRECLRFSP